MARSPANHRTPSRTSTAIAVLIAFAASPSAARAQPAPPIRLSDEPALKTVVTAESTNRPLSEALGALAKQAKVDLTAEAPIGRQRVTLHLAGQPLSHLMARLPGLLSHAPQAPSGYYWEKLERAAGRRPGYRLWRSSKSRREEQLELDYPRRKCAEMLREFRDLVEMTPAQRKAYKGELRDQYVSWLEGSVQAGAMCGLSDAAMDALIATGTIPLPVGRLTAEVDAYNERWRQYESQNREMAMSRGVKDPYPNGIPLRPSTGPAIRFNPYDFDTHSSTDGIEYELRFDGIQAVGLEPNQFSNFNLLFDPYKSNDVPLSEKRGESTPIFDLTQELTGPAVTAEQRGDIGFTLQVLAKAAKVNLYQEAFYKTARFGGRSRGLRLLKGTLPQLLNAICAEWRYCVRKVGDDYMLWSLTWAQDRSIDIPESALAGWRDREAKQGGFTLDDKFEIVSQLTWPQIRRTLNLAIESSGPWNGLKRDPDIYRFCGGFNAAERRQLVHGGLMLESMEPAQCQALITEVMGRPASADRTDLNGAFLEITYDTAFSDHTQEARLPVRRRAWLSVKTPAASGGAPKTVWYYALFYTAPKLSP